MELLMLNYSILKNCEIFVTFLGNHQFVSLLSELCSLGDDISVFDLDDIFFVFVYGCQQFPLYLDEVLTNLIFGKEADFFLENEIWI